MSEKEPCPNCGDPACDCEKGKCTCTPKAEKTQPTDKYLPKQDMGNIKDGAVFSKPVNPYFPENRPVQKKGYAEMKKAMGAELESLASEEVVVEGVANIEGYHSYAQEHANEYNKFGFGHCGYRQAKDGMFDVNFHYALEHLTPLAYVSNFGNEVRKAQASTSQSHSFCVSRHLDEKSAQLACSDYNIFLALKPCKDNHPMLAFRKKIV
jgi:hypothetical protein